MTTIRSLSILIAAKDEESSISRVIESHHSLMKRYDHQLNWEIGVLDDGSTDNTSIILEEFK